MQAGSAGPAGNAGGICDGSWHASGGNAGKVTAMTTDDDPGPDRGPDGGGPVDPFGPADEILEEIVADYERFIVEQVEAVIARRVTAAETRDKFGVWLAGRDWAPAEVAAAMLSTAVQARVSVAMAEPYIAELEEKLARATPQPPGSHHGEASGPDGGPE